MSAPAAAVWITVAWATAITGCTTDHSAEPSEPASQGAEAELPAARAPHGFSLHTDSPARCSFPIPAQGEVESRHFDASAPLHKIRHQLTLTMAERRVVRIDIWDDPQNRKLSVWAEQHLGFLLNDAAAIRTMALTPAGLEGLLLEHPRSPQAHARTTALLATAGRVFRITCLDSDDADVRSIFDRIVGELETEAAP